MNHFRDNLFEDNKAKILSLCLNYLLNPVTGMMATWENINALCRFKLNELERFYVGSFVQYAKTEFSMNIIMETTKLITFFNRKGSKKYRKIISN